MSEQSTQPEATVRSVLDVLRKKRLLEVAREAGILIAEREKKAAQVNKLVKSQLVTFEDLLHTLGRDELKAACRAHGIDDSGRSRTELAQRLADIHPEEVEAPKPRFLTETAPRYAPKPGDVVVVRRRQYLVEEVIPPPEPTHATRVKLVCLDDDNQGRSLDVLWELELGARVITPEATGLSESRQLDDPHVFGAYLNALKWGTVTATDARLFQSPFRAGIRIMNHQLAPLKKALELPRANLFIADDVGLGKTIEAGLVLQELLLRQRVDFVVIVCPASVALQWREEMQRRFGLHFEIYNRRFVLRRRQERGFGVNPWTTHNRFIITYPTVRRPEYRDPLLAHIGGRVKKSLLILDEAHTAAPSTASKYAIDSRITKVVRDIAPRFENRLFLSATPHNGHSNSFSALLEILDPQRFTRGVPITSTKRLEPVMVRRLKSDLQKIGIGSFPERKVIEIEIDEKDLPELELANLLAEYTALMKPKKGRGKLTFVNLQKRLLSSVYAFERTLKLHADSVGRGKAKTALKLAEPDSDDEYGTDDDAAEDARLSADSAAIDEPKERAKQLLEELTHKAAQYKGAPDAKAKKLVEWIQENQCPAVQIGGAKGSKKEKQWTGRRVIVFTEYGDTKRYLRTLLRQAIEGTDGADDRIMEFHGGMSDDGREEVQRAFNAPPDEHPVRILIATDAAREGVNLQGHCADLFHYDIPWNPAKMEQRNGRIDRTLQPALEVRCHYFTYTHRKEDAVLATVVRKIETIQTELGSLSTVIMSEITSELENEGIHDQTEPRLEKVQAGAVQKETVEKELEAGRQLDALKAEIDEAGQILDKSRKWADFDADALRETLNVGLQLTGAPRLKPEGSTYTLGEMPASWENTIDTLRPPRARDEEFWEWRKKPPQPVTFEAPDTINSGQVHLHLEHPFVKRVMQRFRAQGTSAHDLSRVTVVPNKHDNTIKVIAIGRLSLFGPGATRLHDELIYVAAPWLESKGKTHLKPLAKSATQQAITRLDELLKENPKPPSNKIQQTVQSNASSDFATLWDTIKEEAESRTHEAAQLLRQRGEAEAEELTKILKAQREAIREALNDNQLSLFADTQTDQRQKEQYESDRKHMQHRLDRIEGEIKQEPAQIREMYRVVKDRLEPVGLVFLWPTSLT